MTDTTEARQLCERADTWEPDWGERRTRGLFNQMRAAIIDLAGKLGAAERVLSNEQRLTKLAADDIAALTAERDTLRTKLDEANGQIAKLICDHASEMEAAKSTIAQQKRIIETARVMEDAAAVIGRELEATRQEREALRAQVAEQAREIERLTNENAELRRPFRTDVANLRAELACRVAEVAGVAKERDAARRDATAAQNRLNVAEASLRMRGQEIEQLRADKERLITQADSLTNNLVRARELIEAERARLAECEPVVEAVREMQSCGCQADDCEHTTRVMRMTLPAKRTP
jgi:chromosome segregation ATPase